MYSMLQDACFERFTHTLVIYATYIYIHTFIHTNLRQILELSYQDSHRVAHRKSRRRVPTCIVTLFISYVSIYVCMYVCMGVFRRLHIQLWSKGIFNNKIVGEAVFNLYDWFMLTYHRKTQQVLPLPHTHVDKYK